MIGSRHGFSALVKPHVLVLLGVTAAQAALGAQFRVSRQRGEFLPSNLAPYVLATVHPSSLLRGEPVESAQLEHADGVPPRDP